MRAMPKPEWQDGEELAEIMEHNIAVFMNHKGYDRIDAERIVKEGFKISTEVFESVAERIEKVFPGSELNWDIWHLCAVMIAKNLEATANDDLRKIMTERVAKELGLDPAGVQVIVID